jgi:hypothetical protein
MVRPEGVEPPRLSAPESKSGLSTSSNTSALTDLMVREEGLEPSLPFGNNILSVARITSCATRASSDQSFVYSLFEPLSKP